MRLYEPLIALSVLVEHPRDRARAFSDKVVYSEAISVDDQTRNLLVRNGSTTEHPLQPHALGLLARKLRIPASYLTRCPPELRATNLNHWLRKQGGRKWSCPGFVDTCPLGNGRIHEVDSTTTYPPKCRRRIIELVRAGRTPEGLLQEFEAGSQGRPR